eukprot:g4395.t1
MSEQRYFTSEDAIMIIQSFNCDQSSHPKHQFVKLGETKRSSKFQCIYCNTGISLKVVNEGTSPSEFGHTYAASRIPTTMKKFSFTCEETKRQFTLEQFELLPNFHRAIANIASRVQNQRTVASYKFFYELLGLLSNNLALIVEHLNSYKDLNDDSSLEIPLSDEEAKIVENDLGSRSLEQALRSIGLIWSSRKRNALLFYPQLDPSLKLLSKKGLKLKRAIGMIQAFGLVMRSASERQTPHVFALVPWDDCAGWLGNEKMFDECALHFKTIREAEMSALLEIGKVVDPDLILNSSKKVPFSSSSLKDEITPEDLYDIMTEEERIKLAINQSIAHLSSQESRSNDLSSLETDDFRSETAASLEGAAAVVPGSIASLHNVGNTCYVNVLLQALYHIPHFRSAIFEFDVAAAREERDSLRQAISLSESCNTPAKLKAASSAESVGEIDGDLRVAEEIQLLFGKMMLSARAVIDPTSFVDAVREVLPSMANLQQQDVSEFMTLLLEVLQKSFSDDDDDDERVESSENETENPITRLFFGTKVEERTLTEEQSDGSFEEIVSVGPKSEFCVVDILIRTLKDGPPKESSGSSNKVYINNDVQKKKSVSSNPTSPRIENEIGTIQITTPPPTEVTSTARVLKRHLTAGSLQNEDDGLNVKIEMPPLPPSTSGDLKDELSDLRLVSPRAQNKQSESSERCDSAIGPNITSFKLNDECSSTSPSSSSSQQNVNQGMAERFSRRSSTCGFYSEPNIYAGLDEYCSWRNVSHGRLKRTRCRFQILPPIFTIMLARAAKNDGRVDNSLLRFNAEIYLDPYLVGPRGRSSSWASAAAKLEPLRLKLEEVERRLQAVQKCQMPMHLRHVAHFLRNPKGSGFFETSEITNANRALFRPIEAHGRTHKISEISQLHSILNIEKDDARTMISRLDRLLADLEQQSKTLHAQRLHLRQEICKVYSKESRHCYRLHTIIMHRGDFATSGHYYSYINPTGKEWIKFDDREITRHVSHVDVMLEAQGGPTASASAYLLIYLRNDTEAMKTFIEAKKVGPSESIQSLIKAENEKLRAVQKTDETTIATAKKTKRVLSEDDSEPTKSRSENKKELNPTEADIETLFEMGGGSWTKADCTMALKISDNDVGQAGSLLVSYILEPDKNP